MSRYEGIPQELRGLPCWVCHREGDKVPIDPKTGRNAKSNDPGTWGTFEQATGWAARNGGGIGFEFAEDAPFCGIDLDHVRDADTGELAPWAREVVDALDTYTEVSPSGTGLHLIARAGKPEGGSKRANPDGTAFEMYDHGRYFRMTGEVFEGHGTIGDRQGAVSEAHARWIGRPSDGGRGDALEWGGEAVAATGATGSAAASPSAEEAMGRMRRSGRWPEISRLWGGDTSGCGGDHSAADMALCNHLAYFCDRDEAVMDELFRRSGLMRGKWDEEHHPGDPHPTYGSHTVHEAASTCRECYSERRGEGGEATEHCPWLRLSDYIGDNMPEEEPDIIDGLLGYGEKSVLYGASKAGKSWVSMHLAVALATGTPFLGHECTTTPGTVFYMNLEIKDIKFRKRFDGIRQVRGWDKSMADNIRWLPRKEAIATAKDAKSAVDVVLKWAKPGDFAVFDCLYMMLDGGDENSAQTMQPMMREFDRLLEEGECSGVWLVHHQAKGASGQKSVIDRGAGSGVVSRFVDNVFSLDYLDTDPEDEYVRQADAQKLYPRRLSYVLRNVEADADHTDFLYHGPRLVTDAGGGLSRFYISGSPQANGSHSGRGNRERAEQDWAAKAELVGAALEEGAREGASPTVEYVSAYYAAHHGEYGLGKRAGLGTIRNWLKPGCASLPFHTEGGVVVPNEAEGEGQ